MRTPHRRSTAPATLAALLALGLCGCLQSGSPEAPTAESTPAVDAVEATEVAFNSAGAPVVEFDAPGMHCAACAASVVAALREEPGVLDAKADAESKMVWVAVDEAQFEADDAIAAINDAGFGDAALHDAQGAASPAGTAEQPESDKAG